MATTKTTEKVKKSTFQSMLEKSHKEIRGQRALLLSKDAERKMRKVVEVKEEIVEDLEMKILNLSDLSPDSTTTLKVTKSGFNAKSWAEQLIDTKTELKLAKQELLIAEETYNEFF
jgi:L-lactate utilization protein LutB